jgi:hypothetical protein
MNPTLIMAVVDPRAERLRVISEGMRQGPDLTSFLMLLAAALAFTLLILVGRRYFNGERAAPPPPDFFEESLEALGLTPSQCDVLRRLARRSRLEIPATMLLSPGNLAHGVARARLVLEDASLRRGVEEVCQALYGVPLPTPDAKNSPPAPAEPA